MTEWVSSRPGASGHFKFKADFPLLCLLLQLLGPEGWLCWSNHLRLYEWVCFSSGGEPWLLQHYQSKLSSKQIFSSKGSCPHTKKMLNSCSEAMVTEYALKTCQRMDKLTKQTSVKSHQPSKNRTPAEECVPSKSKVPGPATLAILFSQRANILVL